MRLPSVLRVLSVVWCALLVACATTGRRASQATQIENAEKQFKYGSVGIESEEGIPYWIDPVRVGFISDGDAARHGGVLYDTQRPGNGHAGHLYGTRLSAAEKQALIEFVKTL